MRQQKFGLLAGMFSAIVAIATLLAYRTSGAQASNPQVIDDSQLQALTATMGGASVLPTTRTVQH